MEEMNLLKKSVWIKQLNKATSYIIKISNSILDMEPELKETMFNNINNHLS